ncbi:TetR/AcrR family transcriptional regulator [Mycobacterium sp. 236(2023)]|uniref:TetR/AcrR family transcriptional regulator n=1 Tax=Mycobacterium sp. 236(2023) TaxID=3038163 RepID=UPI0024152DB3|nr:TetR/AcrR family transcriptional regulator [Mycobacterium sp. 236(2023)]MDG4667503.1 TetR/AcrR family transcriptional regulator [Mycobacterium sp. 236(2023)]
MAGGNLEGGVVQNDWLLGDRRAEAAERIYAAATELILRDGLDAFDMVALQARVHCSRATIYRHVGGKAQIREAVLMREAERIITTVRAAVDSLSGSERTVTAVVVALERIRSDPMGQALLSSMRSGDLSSVGRSPMLPALAAELTGIAEGDSSAAQWIVRVVLSLLVWPVDDPVSEREMIARFLSPASSAPR